MPSSSGSPDPRDAVRRVYQGPEPSARVLGAIRSLLDPDAGADDLDATDPDLAGPDPAGPDSAGPDPGSPDPGSLDIDDLAAVDAFHIRGRDGTVALAELAGVESGSRILDVGSGLGGTARYLATRFDADVVGVDLVPDYVGLARTLSQMTGLENRTSFREGSAVDLPVSDAAFDVAWLEHVQMNVPDKAALARELVRVIRPGGRIAVYEIFRTDRGDLHFPVPWADDASASFLVEAVSFRNAMTEAGARGEAWEDVTEVSLAWFRGVLDRVGREGPPPLGIHLLMGEAAPTKLQNMRRNLEEGRIRVVQAVFEV